MGTSHMANEVQHRASGWIGNGQCLPAQVRGLGLQNCEAVFRILACLPCRAIPAGEWSWVFSWKEEQKMRRISPRGPQPWPEAPQEPSTPVLTLGPDLRPKGRDTGAGAMLVPGLHTPLSVGERTGLRHGRPVGSGTMTDASLRDSLALSR